MPKVPLKSRYYEDTMGDWSVSFFLNSALLGVGLAMDAFTVSLANGLNCPTMKKGKTFFIAGTFAVFQALMPLLGWICVHTVLQYFSAVAKAIPYVSLVLLVLIGGKMIFDGVKEYKAQKNAENAEQEDRKPANLKIVSILVQGIATSIDALSVGFTIAEYGWQNALVCAVIIAAITFALCLPAVFIGKKFGDKFSYKATILGGIILIAIGLEICITGVIG